jgi:serine/threonine protein kinase
VGTVFRGKWRIDALLGVGGMAAVYAVTHRNGHRCAIKVLLPRHRTSPEIVRRFLKEGYAANEVGHAGAVTILDDDVTEEGEYFLVMELLEGRSLDRRLREGSKGMAPEEVARILVEVLDVLAAAHDRGIVHRDIKPENVFLLTDGRIKVLDFGIARIRQAQTESGTQLGAVMGTPAYMPPEQARGRWDEVDARSDLWSVGATGFAAMAGRPVRSAATTNEELLQAMTEPPPPLHSVKPDAPPMVCDVIDRALSFDKAARWSDARAMQAALRAALGEEAPTLLDPPPAVASPDVDTATAATSATAATAASVVDAPHPRRPRGRIVAGAVSLAAAGVFLCAVLVARRAGAPKSAEAPLTTSTAVSSNPLPATEASTADDVDSGQPAATSGKPDGTTTGMAPRPRAPSRKPAAGPGGNDAAAAPVSAPTAAPDFDPLGRRR